MMFNKLNTVDAITAQMQKMVKDLSTLASKREALAARALQQAQQLQDKAELDFTEAKKARTVADKSEVVKPTCDDLRAAFDEEPGWTWVSREYGQDDHGYEYTEVYRRESDQTYWMVNGVNQGGGCYDSVRDEDDFYIFQVWPIQVTKTEYTMKAPE